MSLDMEGIARRLVIVLLDAESNFSSYPPFETEGEEAD